MRSTRPDGRRGRHMRCVRMNGIEADFKTNATTQIQVGDECVENTLSKPRLVRFNRMKEERESRKLRVPGERTTHRYRFRLPTRVPRQCIPRENVWRFLLSKARSWRQLRRHNLANGRAQVRKNSCGVTTAVPVVVTECS